MLASRQLHFPWVVAFPRAAIGLGARWNIVEVHDNVKAVESFTLTSYENETLKLRSTTSFTYVAESTPAPVHGTAEWTVRLDEMAAAGTIHVSLEGHPELDSTIEVHTHD